MRGLKQKFNDMGLNLKASHLLQMRGLKPNVKGLNDGEMKSHLLQMRGLKHTLISSAWNLSDIVASFTDAWIETHP